MILADDHQNAGDFTMPDPELFETPRAATASGAPSKRKLKLKKVTRLATPVKRQISSIGFPYVDLEMVIAVARAMHDTGGLALTRDQLGGALRQSPSSGSFVLKTSAARQFGLIEATPGNKYQLTQLGFAIVSRDDAQEKAARVAAFLSVELYRRAYEEFKGRPLPPRPHGLENAFVQFGVAPKQKDTARQIFEKSARQAGFFNVAPDRLIEPVTNSSPSADRMEREVQVSPPSTISHEAAPSLDPLIQGLVDRLPVTGSTWEPDKRARWLQTLAANFDMIYEADNKSTVVVEVRRDPLSD